MFVGTGSNIAGYFFAFDAKTGELLWKYNTGSGVFSSPATYMVNGEQFVAVASGVVIWSGPRFGYGDMVEVNHGNGYVTRYAHNADNLVAVGDTVRRGQVIARMGDSGRATGPNLHFEVLLNDKVVDPLTYIGR